MVECPVCGSLKIQTSGQFYKCTNCKYVWKRGCPTCGRKVNDNTVKRH
jgi:rubrerythrin